jgi:imidazolonepropionase-like amidohydrolase
MVLSFRALVTRASRIGARFTLPALALATFCIPPLEAATPRVHAIVGARIIPAPGQVIPRGTIVIRDGVITAVGANASVPADARIWKGDSLTVYAGLIDACVPMAEATSIGGAQQGPRRPSPAPAGNPRGAAHPLASVTPELRIADKVPATKDQVEALRRAGFTTANLIPRSGIVRGQSAVVGLADPGAANAVIAADVAQVISIEPARGTYPASLMGAIAVIRQAFMDARWYRDANLAYTKSPGIERPEANLAWDALQLPIVQAQPVMFVTDDMLEVLRAAAIAREADVRCVIVGAGDEYKRVKDIAATNLSLIVPVAYPEAPDVSDPADAYEVSTEQLRHWDRAPSNASVLAKSGVTFALTANGLKDVKTFRGAVARAIARGLPRDQALAAVTTVPARLLGLGERMGTIAPGRIANLTVMRGDLFGEKSTVREVWVDGNRIEVEKDSTALAGKWTLEGDTLLVTTGRENTVQIIAGHDTLRARNVKVDDQRLRFAVDRAGSPRSYDLSASLGALSGTSATGGTKSAVSLARLADSKPEVPKPDVPLESGPVVMGDPEAWRAPVPPQPSAVLIRKATVWTSGPQGMLENADVLVKGGRISAIGRNLSAPGNAVVIDGTGKHVSPGVIDEHSHSAILGDVNECTNILTCEVRIQDVINSESRQIYQQLAGGTTEMHLLHGSCNAIGGQCVVIKNRWGADPDALVFKDAPPTVKFALGENPKQSNWGADATGRYPQSRGGVEQIIRDAFLRAKDYEAKRAEYARTHRGLPVRRDLQLDALAEIVDGKRLIHCHSYRQDEILMLMRLTESFGFRVNTFTHILEGYKVADEMAAHGASALGFSDWWAYKYEVIDAIPWNGYLTWSRGVNTGFNSDDSELARRLNTESAKAVKYGGVPPAEALKFVTANPARSLKVEQRVGSLEVGKDADFVVWSASPLSPYAVAEQTWIEGRKYFDRAEDLAGRAALEKERMALIEKAKDTKGGKRDGGAARKWGPRYLEETSKDGNECNGTEAPFLGEAERRARMSGEENR